MKPPGKFLRITLLISQKNALLALEIQSTVDKWNHHETERDGPIY